MWVAAKYEEYWASCQDRLCRSHMTEHKVMLEGIPL